MCIRDRAVAAQPGRPNSSRVGFSSTRPIREASPDFTRKAESTINGNIDGKMTVAQRVRPLWMPSPIPSGQAKSMAANTPVTTSSMIQ